MSTTNDLPDWAQVVAQPDTILPGSPTLYNSGSTSSTWGLPTGVHMLSIVLQDYPDVTSLTVVGETTGVPYLDINPSTQTYQHNFYALIPGGAETEVTITTVASAAGRMWVTGISSPLAVATLPQNPAPWQAPTGPGAFMSFGNPGSGNSATIIAAPTGNRSIWLHSMWWSWSVASSTVIGTFQDGDGVDVGADIAVTAGIPRYADFKGQRLAPDSAFIFKQSGAAAANTSFCFGGVTYSVY